MWSRVFGQLINRMSGTSYDALGSPGFDPEKLSGDRLELMKELAQKAKGWILAQSDKRKC